MPSGWRASIAGMARSLSPRLQSPGFAELLSSLAASAPLVAGLAARGEIRRFRKDLLFIQEGERGDTIYVVLSGKLRAFSEDDRGREITYGTYGVGEIVGEMSLDGGPRSANVEAVQDSVCAVVTRVTLAQYIADEPSFAFELLAKVIRRARAATVATRQLALNDVYSRLKALLEDLAETQSDGTLLIVERPTHQEMAQRLGCSREMVSRLMKDLQTGGLVLVVGRSLVIKGRLPMRW